MRRGLAGAGLVALLVGAAGAAAEPPLPHANPRKGGKAERMGRTSGTTFEG